MKENILDILKRIKDVLDLRFDGEIADLLGMTKSALSQRRNRNSIPYDQIKRLCGEKNLSLEYILYGTGSPHSSNRPVEMPGQQAIPPNTSQFPPSVSDRDMKFTLLLAKTINVLKSGTRYARSLESSIEAFDSAVNDIKELETTKKKVDNLQSRVSQLETTLSEEKEESSGGEDH